jgi:hypothetical protein
LFLLRRRGKDSGKEGERGRVSRMKEGEVR